MQTLKTHMLHSSCGHNSREVTGSEPPWPEPPLAGTPRLYQNAVIRCTYLGGIDSSAMISSLHNSIHPPDMEINPPKMACGCLGGRVIKKGKEKKATCAISQPWFFFNLLQCRIKLVFLLTFMRLDLYLHGVKLCDTSTGRQGQWHILCYMSTGGQGHWHTLCMELSCATRVQVDKDIDTPCAWS